MNRLQWLGLWAAAAAIGVSGLGSSPEALPNNAPLEEALRPGSFTQARPSTEGESSRTDLHIDSARLTAPFRRGRKAALIAYTPEAVAHAEIRAAEDAAAAAAAEAAAQLREELEAQRPEWTLTAIVLGEPSVAVLRGADGSPVGGGAVAVGDQIAGFTISQIMKDQVQVSSGETQWTYVLRVPWR